MVFAILPAKGFGEAKQRLAQEIGPGPRRALAEAMFSDALRALHRCPAIERVLVVTADADAGLLAESHGAGVVAEQARGHSAAAALGASQALTEGANGVLLVPGDCPLIEPHELETLIAGAADGVDIAIVPDRHRAGTNALLLTPPDALAPAFGPGSCERHVALAREQGIEPRVLDVPSLALDVDTPEDLRALNQTLRERHGGAPHTRGMLGQLRRGGQL